MKKVCLIALGCPKNIVEGENIAGLIKSMEFELTTNINDADSVVVHTCSFIADAMKESTDLINNLIKLKKSGKIEKIIVSGCMVQSEGENILSKFSDIDGFAGTGCLDKIPKLLKTNNLFLCDKPGGLLESKSKRLLSSPLPSAYLRIAEGCSHRCSFCIIPKIRGNYQSRKIASIVNEAKYLAAKGIKEIILIAQDTTCYGKDLYNYFALPDLLKKLVKIEGIKWIRLMYAYPDTINDKLLDLIKNEEKICKYIDMPVQHVNDTVLKRMYRPAGVKKTIEKIKNTIPEIALRSTIITGFPGETEKQFQDLLNFVSNGCFDQLGVFEYSPQKGTASAGFNKQISDTIKAERKKQLMLTQQTVVQNKNKLKFNSVFEVMVEEKNKNSFSGRAFFQAPEIDSKIFFTGNPSGSFVNVKIYKDKGYDLIGKIIEA